MAMEMRTEGPIKTRREGAILEVTLDAPKANAISLKTSRVMGLTFRDFRDDDSLRVCIIRAAGEKFFCPGWDLKAAAEGDAVDGDALEEHRVRAHPVATITIERPVEHQRLQGLGVAHHAEQPVLAALVVAVAAGRGRGQGGQVVFHARHCRPG